MKKACILLKLFKSYFIYTTYDIFVIFKFFNISAHFCYLIVMLKEITKKLNTVKIIIYNKNTIINDICARNFLANGSLNGIL